LNKHPGEHDLEARIASYELAARMQDSAREALDIAQETKATQQLYGIDQEVTRDYGTRCLIARRMVERGVRFVQLFHSGQPWDNHKDLNSTLPSACRKTDIPSSGLVKDLKQRGMLDEVLVHWGGEIGRLPVVEGDPMTGGRDHNGQGFSTWLAGGGIQGGMTYGINSIIYITARNKNWSCPKPGLLTKLLPDDLSSNCGRRFADTLVQCYR